MQLLTERLLLREQTLHDAEAANAYESQEAAARHTSHSPRSLAESRADIESVLAEQTVTPRRLYDLAITLRSGSPMIGRAGVSIQSDATTAAIWYILHPDHQGRGLATEAMREMIRFSFAELGLRRLYAEIDPRNDASIALVERLGLRREAHLVENVFLKGAWCDTLIYAILSREWRG